ncbi:MAG: hypothetical protein K6U14_03295 [Firmicutes bacterium]|nr:hypothetical protein [Alicyclobacillaceae bacterium]MCL6496644.1 hypothetical protein [Bacillota bacterium]
MAYSSGSSLDDLLPFLLLGRHHDLLPLLLLLGGERGFSSSSHYDNESESSSATPSPVTFAAYLAGLIGDVIEITTAPPFGPVVIGRLTEVSTDHVILRNVVISGIAPLAFHERFAVPIPAIVSVRRTSPFEQLIPFLFRERSSS